MTARDDDRIHAFINCADKDRIIAETLEGQLKQLTGRYTLDCFLDCSIMPGEDWESVISVHLRITDLLIVIFTGDQSEYCGFEIGMFTQINKDLNRYNRIICLYDEDKTTLPAVLERHKQVKIHSLGSNPHKNLEDVILTTYQFESFPRVVAVGDKTGSFEQYISARG